MCYEGLMLNKKSNHPEHMKQACVCNTIQTYTAICSTDGLLEEAEQTFKEERYGTGMIAATLIKPKESLPTLIIPYVSSGFTNDIKRAVKRSNLNVRIVQRLQSSLKNLVESRPHDKTCKDPSKCLICQNSSVPVNCSQKDVVY